MNPIHENIRALAKTRQGKEFIWWLLEQTGVYSSTHVDSPHHSAYNEGRRSVGVSIIELLSDSDPTIYPKLLMEKIKNED